MNTRNLALDCLKVILALMVVGIHCKIFSDTHIASYILTTQGLFRIAVPIFFLIGGFYFSQITTTQNLFKWVKRLMILYLFWTLFYVYFWLYPQPITLGYIAYLIRICLFGYMHLWYLPAMLGAGVICYLLRNQPQLGAVVAFVLFSIGVSIQYAGAYHWFEHPLLAQLASSSHTHRNFLFLGFPFFFLGHLIRRFNIAQALPRYYFGLAAILGIGLLLAESWYYFRYTLEPKGFDNIASLILVCPAIFLLAASSKLSTHHSFFTVLSSAIYFTHPFWIKFSGHFFHFNLNTLAIITALLTVLFALPLMMLQKKVKFIL
ncbi:acyltransferase family protein [Vibrio intestinalis]|uniref:acyltransferase family protein n=1 Tax=Vibrio intestinalis TaxID=2933291 RepID=UPI0021A8C962|nr:acyltransferase [Vibrio intestinalis]